MTPERIAELRALLEKAEPHKYRSDFCQENWNLMAAATDSLPELLAMADALVEWVEATDWRRKLRNEFGTSPNEANMRCDLALAEARRLVSGGGK